MSATKKFETEINLDDEEESKSFFERYANWALESIAEDLGFDGEGNENAAADLLDYACLKLRACRWRREGLICLASAQEEILDSIYHDKILPAINCW